MKYLLKCQRSVFCVVVKLKRIKDAFMNVKTVNQVMENKNYAKGNNSMMANKMDEQIEGSQELQKEQYNSKAEDPNYARLFHLATAKEGEVWHERINAIMFADFFTCSCGYQARTIEEFALHTKKSNPTYSHADEILKRMREYCGEERYRKFVAQIGKVRIVPPYISYQYLYYEEYILDPSALCKKAREFVIKMKGE